MKVIRCSVARIKGDTYKWEPLRILARAKGNQLLSREWNGEALEHIIEEGLEGLSAWESACSVEKCCDVEKLMPVNNTVTKILSFLIFP